MIIKKIGIKNFKSIKEMEFEFEKIGDSYTKFLIGLNEAGKSNILEALSFIDTPTGDFDFLNLCNQKGEQESSIDLNLYLEFEDKEIYREVLDKEIYPEGEFDFVISNVQKTVCLLKNDSQFQEFYGFDVEWPNKELFYSEIGGTLTVADYDPDGLGNVLTEEKFKEIFEEKVIDIIKKNESGSLLWTTSDDCLLSDVDLMEYKENVLSNRPLRNVFFLAGYQSKETIVSAIENVRNSQKRSKLVSKLTVSLNEYLKKVWDHNIEIIIDITETGKLSFSIRDKGKKNEHDRFSITQRSEGMRYFLSLILSISMETQNDDCKNQLILINEPERGLHPSGIRDMSKELIEIGKKNYVFVATHSPFLVDKNSKERHYIIKKNDMAITQKNCITESQGFMDDEVLKEAFGLDVYRDLLKPHSLVVEGASDKEIIGKALETLNHQDIGITNGHGNNLETLVSKLNHKELSIMVIVDDDKEGKNIKEKVLKVGGIYSRDNVFTIKDLASGTTGGGSIEDLLDLGFISSQFKDRYKKVFKEETTFELDEKKPVISQISDFLKQKEKLKEWRMNEFKIGISSNFQPNKKSLKEKSPLLHELSELIVKKLKGK